MVRAIYSNRGFDFLGVRFYQDNGFHLTDGETTIDIPEKKISTFIDMLEVCSHHMINESSNRADYGKTMSLYSDNGLVIWYKKQDIKIRRDYLRRFFLTLQRIIKKWEFHMDNASRGKYKERDIFFAEV